MPYRKAALLCCTALALAPAMAAAQDAASSGDVTVLERLAIEGAGDDDANSIVAGRTTGGSKIATDVLETPASVSVITAKEIERRDADTIEEVLDYTAGVTTDFYGADDRFDFLKIRGFDAYTYRDGLTLGSSFGGIREEPYAFERVEVLKGASSTVYGVSDPGGAVNYVTKQPKKERFGEAYATGGSFSHGEVGVDFGDNLTKDGTLSYRLTGKVKDSEAEYDHSRDDEVFLMGGLTWRPTDATSLTVVYDHLDKDGVPGSGGYPTGIDFDRSTFFGEPDYNYRGVDRDTVSAMLDHDFGNGLSFRSNARYSDRSSDFGYAYVSATPTGGSTVASRAFFANESAEEDFIADAHLQYETRFANVESVTLVGVEYHTATSDAVNSWGAAPGIDWTNPVYTGAPTSVPVYSSTLTDQDTRALYLQQNLTFADRLIATVGLRNDWIDTTSTNRLAGTTAQGDFSEPTGRFGLTYKVTKEVAAYASYAQSVVPASIGVEPERGEQYEIGVKYQPEAFPALFTAAVYDLTKTDITRTDPVTNLPSTIGEVRVRGVDLEAKAELPFDLSLTAAYSYLDSEIVENGTSGNEGNRLSFVPEHIASLWLNYTLRSQGRLGDMSFGLGARYESAYYFDDANTIGTGDHVVFDAAYSYDFNKNTTLQVNVSNLFDEKHVAYGGFGANFYNPGREITATLRRTW
jgi:iron complex outermembrane receptor protein